MRRLTAEGKAAHNRLLSTSWTVPMPTPHRACDLPDGDALLPWRLGLRVPFERRSGTAQLGAADDNPGEAGLELLLDHGALDTGARTVPDLS
jgi:hypothetical protein